MDVTGQELAAQLDRIEASSGFRRAGRLARFLRYVCEETAGGRAEALKEYAIAIEVFGKPPSYDPQVDSLVRVQASLLRTRLEQYYSGDGQDDPVRIEIPKGGYAPVFRRIAPRPLPRARRRRALVAAAAAGVVLLTGGAWVAVAGHHKTATKTSPAAEAYRHYQTGAYWRITPTVTDLRKAVGEFTAAVSADPAYAAAQAGLAEAYGRLYYTETVSAEESVVPAKAAAAKALELDEHLSQAHEAAALMHLIDWDLVGAEREYRRALQLEPNQPRVRFAYAQLCLVPAGRYADAIEQLRRAVELDPVNMNVITELGSAYRVNGNLALAREQLQKSLQLNPVAPGTRTNLAITDVVAGDYSTAVRALEAINNDAPADPWIMGHLGYAYAKAGRIAEARRVLADLTNNSTAAMHIAAIQAGLGDSTAALDSLERGLNARSPSLLWLKSDFRFDSLRTEPRYAAIQARLP